MSADSSVGKENGLYKEVDKLEGYKEVGKASLQGREDSFLCSNRWEPCVIKRRKWSQR
jgi:hypothetical protein